MRIGIDIKALRAQSTGIARYLRCVLDALQELDTTNRYYLFEKRDSGYQVHNPRWQKVVIPSKLPGTAWLLLNLSRRLGRYSLDVFWAPEHVGPIFCSRQIRLVSTVHDLTFMRYPHTMQLTNRLINRMLTPPLVRRSDAVLAVSAFTRHELRALLGNHAPDEKIVVTPNGGPDWETPASYDAGARSDYLFYAGNFEPRKNLLGLLKAMRILREGGRPVRLKIAGPPGWGNGDAHRFIEQNAMQANIEHVGYLSEEELKHHYLHCRAFVYPSIYEGFGLPVLEALSLDCVVLTSKGSVMEEVAGSCALYFDPDDPHDIARAIQAVFRSDFDRRKVLRGRRAVLRSYTWEENARLTLEAFSRVVERDAAQSRAMH